MSSTEENEKGGELNIPPPLSIFVKTQEIKNLTDQMTEADPYERASISARILKLSKEVKDITNGLSGIVKEVDFEHEGKTYNIRVTFDGRTYKVRAFLDNKPVNPFTHSVSLETALDFGASFNSSAIELLIHDAKQDIIEHRWENLLKLRTKST